MRFASAVVAIACCAAVAVPAAQDQEPRIRALTGPQPANWEPVPLLNAGFEAAPVAGNNCPPNWGCSMHADPHSYLFQVEASQAAEGKQVACIVRVTPEPWSLMTQYVAALPLRGARARVSVAVRIESGQELKAGPWIAVRGGSGQTLAMNETPLAATQGWQRVSAEVPVASDAFGMEIGVTQQGGGRACFDDVRVEVLR